MTKSLFPELEFTRENVLAWAEEQVAPRLGFPLTLGPG
jgi:hypothetical protein